LLKKLQYGIKYLLTLYYIILKAMNNMVGD